ncbi:TPA: hypothetical protein DEF17_01580, partial [bacterium]|nr:hypothetical protein [bacterium]
PSAPTGVTATGGNQTVWLAWNAVSGSDLEGYKIYRKSVGSEYSLLTSLGITTSYTDTQVTNDSTYYYIVRAYDRSSNLSDSSLAVSVTPSGVDTTPPQATTGVRIGRGEFNLTVSWNANLEYDLAGYKVYRSITPGAGHQLIETTAQTSRTYGGLNPTDTYYFVIRAYDNNSNESDSSAETGAQPLPNTPPSAPLGLSATAGNASCTLTWNANSEIDSAGYNVFRALSQSGPFAKINGSTVALTSYADTSLNNDSTYYYLIKAVDTAGAESDSSSIVSATPKAGIAVKFRVDVSTVGSPTAVQIAGDQFSPAWTPTASPMANEGNEIWYVAKTLPVGTRLQYKYVRDTSNWESDFPANESVNREITVADQGSGEMYVNNKWNIDGDPVPSQPTLNSPTVGDGTLSFTWTSVSDYDLLGYSLYRSTTPGSGHIPVVVKTRQMSLIDSGLTNGQNYYYYVVAIDSAGQSSGYLSEVLGVPMAPDTTPPSAPSAMDANVSGGAIVVTWNASPETDVAGYNIYRSTALNGSYSKLNSSLVAATTYSDNSVSVGTTYYYRLRAQDGAGNLSDTSAADSATISGSAIVIDGNPSEWQGSAPDTDRAYRIDSGIWRWWDPVADERSEGVDPDDNYDLTDMRVTGDLSNLYLLWKFNDITATNLPYVMLAVDKDQTAGSGEQWFADNSDVTMNNSARREYQLAINVNKTGYFGVGEAQWTWTDTGSSWISDANNCIEASFKWYSLGVTLPAKIRFTCGIVQNNDSGGVAEISGADVIDAVTDAAGNTWTDVSDGQLDYYFDIGFNIDGTVNQPPQSPTITAPSAGANLTQSNVTFSWTVNDTDGSIAQNPLYEIQVSTDSTFGTVTWSESGAGSITSTSHDFVTSGAHYLRIRTRDDHDWSSWTSIRNFTITGSGVPDGDPSNWKGTAPSGSNTYTVDTGEFIFTDATIDERTDVTYSSNADIKEFRLTGDTTYLYLLAKFRDITDASLPYLGVAVDTDQINASGEKWFGGYSDCQIDTAAWREIELVVNNNKTGYYGVGANGWDWNSNAVSAISTSYDAIEARYSWSAMKISLPKTLRFTVIAAQNNAGMTTDIYQCNALDVINQVSGNTWNDVQDSIANFYFDLNFNASGKVNASPSNPVLVSPTNSVTYNTSTVTFQWSWRDSDYRDAVNSRTQIQIATDSAFSNVIATQQVSGSGDTGKYTFSTGGRYYWRVRTTDDFETSSWSDSRLLNVDYYVPPVTLIAPANGIETNASFMRFAWSAPADDLSGLDSYALQISTSSSFDTYVQTRTVDSNSWQVLTYGETNYYWRVKYIDKAGNESASVTRTFRLDTQVSVALTSPADNTETRDSRPTFTWSSLDADTYIFQLSSDTSFSSLYDSVNLTAALHTPSNYYPHGTWYWRAIARDRIGNVDTSSSRKIVIDTDVTVSLVSPSDYTETKNQRPTFAWTGDADTYTFKISKSIFFSSIYDSITQSGISYTPSGNYDGDTFYWIVIGIDNLGNTETTMPWQLSIDTGVSAFPESPSDSYETNDTTPQFIWNGTADTFIFQISRDTAFAQIADSAVTTGTTYTSAGYGADTYYWRVIAENNIGETKASSYRMLVVDTKAVVNLVSPSDFAETNAVRPYFTWTSDGETFVFQSSTDSTFAVYLESTSLTSNNRTATVDYAAGTWYWRVEGRDRAGNYGISQSNRLIVDTDVSINLTAPPNGMRTNDTTPAFAWTSDGDSFLFEASRYDSFSILIDSAYTVLQSYIPTSGYGADTYYWRVIARDTAGNIDTSSSYSFAIDTYVNV